MIGQRKHSRTENCFATETWYVKKENTNYKIATKAYGGKKTKAARSVISWAGHHTPPAYRRAVVLMNVTIGRGPVISFAVE